MYETHAYGRSRHNATATDPSREGNPSMHTSLPVALAALALLVTTSAVGETGDEVGSSVHAFYKALSEGDVDVLAASMPATGFTEFNTGSSELQTYDLKGLSKAFADGVKIDFHVERLTVEVHGEAAIATGYRVGRLSYDDGRSIDSYNCETIVLTREQSHWLVRHVHLSQCAPAAKRQ
jgi:ketosteroid isomerase-like protein